MTISEEQIVILAQEYLSKLQRANQVEFATIKPGVGQDYYDFLDGLEAQCSHLADDYRIGYQNKEVGSVKIHTIEILIHQAVLKFLVMAKKWGRVTLSVIQISEN